MLVRDKAKKKTINKIIIKKNRLGLGLGLGFGLRIGEAWLGGREAVVRAMAEQDLGPHGGGG